MKKLGNNKWSEIKPDDIVDYRVHIPYNIIPKELLQNQSDINNQEQEHKQKQEQQQSEQQQHNENEIEMKKNDNTESLNEWLTNHTNKINEKEYKKEKATNPWNNSKILTIKDMIINNSNWNKDQFNQQMKVMKILKIKNLNTFSGHKAKAGNENEKIPTCKFGEGKDDEEEKGLCWCKLSAHIATNHKLKRYTIYDDDGNGYSLRHNLEEYFRQQLPNITSRNIIRKNHNKSRFFPTVIPSKSKFMMPKFGYNEYIIDNTPDINFQFGANAKCKFKRNPNGKENNLKQTAFIEFVLNPSGDFINNNNNWATELMQNFDKYKGTHFGPNKIKLGFFQSFKMFHIIWISPNKSSMDHIGMHKSQILSKMVYNE